MKMESNLKEIKTCDDCIHCKACEFAYLEAFGKFDKEAYGNAACDEFQDKSRFIELPCAVGDTVYYVIDLGNLVHGQVLKIKVFRIEIKDEIRFYAKTVKYYRYNYTCFDSADFGKTVFRTREEAEKALAERSEGK